MHLWALLLAAGNGTRMQASLGGLAKQFMHWKGVPLYWHSAMTLSQCARLRGLIFVFPPDLYQAEALQVRALDSKHPLGLPWHCVAGGALRQDSVRNALQALPMQCDAMLIHDAARPFASPALVNRVVTALESAMQTPSLCGVVPGIALSDTVKVLQCAADPNFSGPPVLVESTPDRQRLAAVQTPQGFVRAPLQQAHAHACQQRWNVTDDASLLERCHMAVQVVAGEAANCKITNPEDLAMLATPPPMPTPCVGYGYDVHRYASSPFSMAARHAKALLVDAPLDHHGPSQSNARPMLLGGVPIPGAPNVLAHSDGDVLLHALMDAILGCLGAGDIGQHFPDTDAALNGISSAVLLDTVLDMTLRAGLRITHVDITLVAQKPKIGPHRESIHKNVARLLGLTRESINVKATTEEGLGFTGEGKGIKAVAVVTALKNTAATSVEWL